MSSFLVFEIGHSHNSFIFDHTFHLNQSSQDILVVHMIHIDIITSIFDSTPDTIKIEGPNYSIFQRVMIAKLGILSMRHIVSIGSNKHDNMEYFFYLFVRTGLL